MYRSVVEVACSPSSECGRRAGPPGTTLGISASRCQSFELCLLRLCFTLFWASVSNTCPKMTASSLYAISAYRRFPRMFYFKIVGKPVSPSPFTSATSTSDFSSQLQTFISNAAKPNLNSFTRLIPLPSPAPLFGFVQWKFRHHSTCNW